MLTGYRTLGCNVTLSPFNVALAFDAPILNDINSAAGAKGVVNAMGGMQLQFGATGMSGQHCEEINGLNEGHQSGRRLGMGLTQDVEVPRKGMRFDK